MSEPLNSTSGLSVVAADFGNLHESPLKSINCLAERTKSVMVPINWRVTGPLRAHLSWRRKFSAKIDVIDHHLSSAAVQFLDPPVFDNGPDWALLCEVLQRLPELMDALDGSAHRVKHPPGVRRSGCGLPIDPRSAYYFR